MHRKACWFIILSFSNTVFSEEACDYSRPLASITACYEAKAKKSDDNLNDAFRKLKKAVEHCSYENKATKAYWDGFIESQRSWIKMRDEQCIAKTSFYEKGSYSQQIELNKCRLMSTEQRYEYIEEEFKYINELP